MCKSSLTVVGQTYQGFPAVEIGGHIIESDEGHLDTLSGCLMQAVHKLEMLGQHKKKIFIIPHKSVRVDVGGRGSGIIRHLKNFIKKHFHGGHVELEIPVLIKSNGGQKIVRP